MGESATAVFEFLRMNVLQKKRKKKYGIEES
jgi:hypothetical protein